MPTSISRASELRVELARKIALYVGSAENRTTAVRGLTLHRRTAPTAPCSMTYEPNVTVMAQGRKRVELGRNVFIYASSRFLLTAVDLPVVSRVSEATEERHTWRYPETRNAGHPRTPQPGGDRGR
jgi:hypothetical protein